MYSITPESKKLKRISHLFSNVPKIEICSNLNQEFETLKCGIEKNIDPHFLVFQLFLSIELSSSTVEIEIFLLSELFSSAEFIAWVKNKTQNTNFFTSIIFYN